VRAERLAPGVIALVGDADARERTAAAITRWLRVEARHA
jgi:hypothetical protein